MIDLCRDIQASQMNTRSVNRQPRFVGFVGEAWGSIGLRGLGLFWVVAEK